MAGLAVAWHMAGCFGLAQAWPDLDLLACPAALHIWLRAFGRVARADNFHVNMASVTLIERTTI